MNSQMFNYLLNNLSKIKEKQERENQENSLFIDIKLEENEVSVKFCKIFFVFDLVAYEKLKEFLDEDSLIIKDDYLYIKYGEISAHRYIKLEEVNELANKLNCPIEDIHVHHKNKNKHDNFWSNLEVLHKDKHAEKHGFDTWEEYSFSLKFRRGEDFSP